MDFPARAHLSNRPAALTRPGPRASLQSSSVKDFGSALACIDGRFQRRTSDYLTQTFGVRSIDTITAAGMIKNIAEPTDRTPAILADLQVSVDKHKSTQIGVVAHADCAANPVSDDVQKKQVADAVASLESMFPDFEVVGLWIDENSIVERIRPAGQA